MVSLQDRLDRIDDIIRRARAAGNTRAVAEAVDLLGQLLRQVAADETAQAAFTENSPNPMTRARAREAAERETDSPRQPRKGRDRCGATRRDGEPCQAPAVEGHYVCRRHGGGAPQVQIRARHEQLLMALAAASHEHEAARGTPGEFAALCKALQAGRDLDAYEVKLRLLAELRAAVKRRRAATAHHANIMTG